MLILNIEQTHCQSLGLDNWVWNFQYGSSLRKGNLHFLFVTRIQATWLERDFPFTGLSDFDDHFILEQGSRGHPENVCVLIYSQQSSESDKIMASPVCPQKET